MFAGAGRSRPVAADGAGRGHRRVSVSGCIARPARSRAWRSGWCWRAQWATPSTGVRFGAVVDFLDFHLDGHHWPAFNVADSAIVSAPACILLDSLVLSQAKTQTRARRGMIEIADRRTALVCRRHGGRARRLLRHGPGESGHRQAAARTSSRSCAARRWSCRPTTTCGRPSPARRGRRRRTTVSQAEQILTGQPGPPQRQPETEQSEGELALAGAEPGPGRAGHPRAAGRGGCRVGQPRRRSFPVHLELPAQGDAAQPNVLDPVAEAQGLQSASAAGSVITERTGSQPIAQ